MHVKNPGDFARSNWGKLALTLAPRPRIEIGVADCFVLIKLQVWLSRGGG